MNFLKTFGVVLDGLLGQLTSTFIELLRRNGGGVCLNDVDLGKTSSLDVLSLLLGLIDRSQRFVGRLFLICNFGVDDGTLVDIRQINLDHHEAGNIRVGDTQVGLKSFKHFVTDVVTVQPIVGGVVITSDVQDTVSCDPGINRLIVILKKPINLTQVLLFQVVLESEVDVQLESLLGSS